MVQRSFTETHWNFVLIEIGDDEDGYLIKVSTNRELPTKEEVAEYMAADFERDNHKAEDISRIEIVSPSEAREYCDTSGAKSWPVMM